MYKNSNFSLNTFVGGVVGLVLTWALGLFLVICAGTVIFKTMDYMENVKRVNALEVVDTGRAHILSDMVYSNGKSEYRKCVAVQVGDNLHWHDATPNAKGSDPLCHSMARSTHTWTQTALEAPMYLGRSMMLMALVLVPLAIGCAILLFIPIALVGLVTGVDWIMENSRKLAVFAATPIVVIGLMMYVSDATSPSEAWMYNGNVVHTTEVYITRDGSLHRKANSFSELADPMIGSKIGSLHKE